MKLSFGGYQFPIRFLDSSLYSIVGWLCSSYYLCKSNNGEYFAAYLPNCTEYFPKVELN